MWFFILTKAFINPGYEMSVRLTNITSIAASTNKFINNLWTENIWIRILYVNAWRNLSLVKTSLTLAFLHNLLQTFSILLCVTLEYIPMKGWLKYLVLILGISPDTLFVFVLLIAFWKYFFMTLSIMLRGHGFLSMAHRKN